MHRLTRAHPSPTWQRELHRQDRQLDGLAYSILKDTSGAAAGLSEFGGRDQGGGGRDGGSGPDRWSKDAYQRGAGGHSGGEGEGRAGFAGGEAGREERGRRGRRIGGEGAGVVGGGIGGETRKQLRTLAATVQSLAKEVKEMRQRRQEESMVAQGLGSPAEGIRALVKQVSILAGKVSTIERSPANLRSRDSKEVEAGTYGSLGYQESSFAKALEQGEEALARGDYKGAKMGLRRVRYYHAGILLCC